MISLFVDERKYLVYIRPIASRPSLSVDYEHRTSGPSFAYSVDGDRKHTARKKRPRE